MQYQFNIPESIHGSVLLPSSKSLSNRALIIYALTNKGILPTNLAQCDDTDVMVAALKSKEKEINIMAAGTAMRFLTAYLAITPGERIITGTERMQMRPIHILVDALKSLGADISYLNKEGYPPLLIKGRRLEGNSLELKGDTSSQFITALLLIAPQLPNGLTLNLKGDIISKPYIDMTINLMNQCGAYAKWISDHQIEVLAQPYKPTILNIEPDWSAASYWFEWVALTKNSEIVLENIQLPSLQGDSKGADLFKSVGVDYEIIEKGIRVYQTDKKVEKLEVNFIDIPDLAQTFAVTAALLDIPFHFTGLQSLRIKETDRIDALICEMKKLGYLLQDVGDEELIWDGNRTTPTDNPVIETYEDHRMAMSFAPASYIYPKLRIANPEVVTKSYPQYWEHLIRKNIEVIKTQKD